MNLYEIKMDKWRAPHYVLSIGPESAITTWRKRFQDYDSEVENIKLLYRDLIASTEEGRAA